MLPTVAAIFLLGCAGLGAGATGKERGALELDVPAEWVDPEQDYRRFERVDPVDPPRAVLDSTAPTIAITNATILTADGRRIEEGTIVLKVGAIAALGERGSALPEDALVIDAGGRHVTPGLIDSHSHIGVYSAPRASAHADGNEMVGPVTAHIRAEYAYWPQDPAITRARAGGVTTALVLPGSANLVGGRGVTVVMRPGVTAGDVRFPGAPPTLKMACGENPKRVYGEKGGPQTRMGIYAHFRNAFQQASEYDARWTAYRRNRDLWLKKRARARELDAQHEASGRRVKPEAAPDPPARDLGLETLAAVLRGEVLAQIHCYRADEISEMVAVADEFNFEIRSFHHALEAYKVRNLLVDRDIAISTWADWWGFKMEAFDGIPENAALFAEAGGRPVIHSDSSIGIQRLNQEAAKAFHAGRAAGIDLDENEALRWITANPAWVLGIDSVTGTLQVGKRADVVVWNAHPLSVYALPDLVIQGGHLAYDREKGVEPTDFELGNSAVDRPVAPAKETR